MGFDGTYSSSAFILSTSPPGKFSGLPSRYLSTDIFISTSQPCPMGTHRNTTSWGPCLICPPNMKSGSGMTCEPCPTTNKSTRCFRAAIEEIEMENLTSHTQAYRYPESSDSTEYDDLLLSNIFQLSTVNVRCLLLSPVFWAIIGCLIGLLLVQVFCCCLKRKMAPLLLLDFFSRSNRLKTGQIYARVFLGICFAIFMIFLGIFSLAFAHRYPMERTTIDQWRSAFCDPTLVNSKFSSSLQLLAQLKRDEEKAIFDLLDQQNFTFTVQLIGTGFVCEDLTIEQTRDHGLSVLLTDLHCSVYNTVINMSIPLSQHIFTLQMHLLGPHFIGAIRLCLTGPSLTSTDGKYTLKRLDHCELHWTPNHTLARSPVVQVKLTKVINQTKGMTTHDEVIYSGLWLPALTIPALTDVLLLEKYGEFFRYFSSEMDLLVEMSESEFYIMNVQEPISRAYEITFKTILFSSKSSFQAIEISILSLFVSVLCFDVFGLFLLILRWAAWLCNRLVRTRETQLAAESKLSPTIDLQSVWSRWTTANRYLCSDVVCDSNQKA